MSESHIFVDPFHKGSHTLDASDSFEVKTRKLYAKGWDAERIADSIFVTKRFSPFKEEVDKGAMYRALQRRVEAMIDVIQREEFSGNVSAASGKSHAGTIASNKTTR